MLVTSDDALYQRNLTPSNHARAKRTNQAILAPDEVGFKYKMSNMQAALGVAQIERIDALIDCKWKIFATYADAPAAVSSITLNPEPRGTRNGNWMPTAAFDRESGMARERMPEAFSTENIDAWASSGRSARCRRSSPFPRIESPTIRRAAQSTCRATTT
jgi:perosamine synthetase